MSDVAPIVGMLSAGGGAAAALAWATFRPLSNFWGQIHCRGDPATARYALTFDDGPTPGATDRILDELDRLAAPAAFFCVGINAARWPHLLRRMHAAGHIIANHTLDHAHLAILRGPAYWRRQIHQTDRIIEDAVALRPAMFRPPMGFKTCFITSAAKKSRPPPHCLE